ncbi:Malate dehydrogenase [Chondrus crispus]|uniref:Malate dehydrogenase n=1 Tax=Chondrus crispus TaxID=2769 RepID=R7QPY8_CHOCR|nr:Malate dehydrogenase [Chondrus crispus]CDF40179.1 Malate dehydrogenase [Chondrus crispus]|eukprot:XP_005710473.1 Malate dehydrogenase [Chondrus crispus]
MQDALVAAGVPPPEAAVAAEVLEWADLHGVSTHGIGRLKPIYIDRILAGILKPTAPFEVIVETETTAVVDGHGGLGLYIGPKCMDMCIEKAKKHGLAMVVTRNSTHYGAAGYYVDKAQEHGCIGITGTNARPSIAPTFGVQPMLGTNPITFGMPSDDPFPFILDCATSVNQRGKIEKYAREGKPTPPGQVVDRDGNVRTDTDGILKDLQTGYCSLAPLGGVGTDMGGYKGYGYATVVELLSSALCSGTTSPDLSGVDKATGNKKAMPLGHFFIAIDVERFLPVGEFKNNMGKFLRQLRESEKDPKGLGRIYTAG